MKALIYKIAIILFVFLLIGTSFAGCARETDEAFTATVTALLDKTKTVNEICFGEGILPKENGFASGVYTEADPASLSAFGVQNVSDIRRMVAEVYTAFTCDYVDQVVFNPIRDGATVASYRRYYDGALDETPLLMVLTDYTPLAVGEVRYENVRITSHGRSRAQILVDITVTKDGYTREEKDVSFSLRYEDGWKFDTVTYASVDANN